MNIHGLSAALGQIDRPALRVIAPVLWPCTALACAVTLALAIRLIAEG